jgi:hypothetical protein
VKWIHLPQDRWPLLRAGISLSLIRKLSDYLLLKKLLELVSALQTLVHYSINFYILFNDAVSSSQYTALNGRMINQ